jgi:hypothetical protein
MSPGHRGQQRISFRGGFFMAMIKAAEGRGLRAKRRR